MSNLRQEVDQVFDTWRAQTPHLIASVTEESNTPLSITVLTHKQSKQLQDALGDHASEIRITVLSHPETETPLGFVSPVAPITALHTSPTLDKLTTEIHPQDGSLRVLANHEEAILVQGLDGTLAWASSAAFQPSKDTWSSLGVLENDGRVRSALSPQELLREARSYLNTPYILGGRSRKRIDCSGFTSLVFRDVFDTVLPRHSTDQRRCGKRTTQAKCRPGDLIFARLGAKNIPHVGFLAEQAGDTTVIHASQRVGFVIEEPIEDFFGGYRFMGMRRILKRVAP